MKDLETISMFGGKEAVYNAVEVIKQYEGRAALGVVVI